MCILEVRVLIIETVVKAASRYLCMDHSIVNIEKGDASWLPMRFVVPESKTFGLIIRIKSAEMTLLAASATANLILESFLPLNLSDTATDILRAFSLFGGLGKRIVRGRGKGDCRFVIRGERDIRHG